MGKRANGEGTLFQIKSGRHVGKWAARVPLEGFTPTGYKKYKQIYGDTEKEVLTKKKQIESQLAQGKFSQEKTTVSKFAEEWLNVLSTRVRPRTIEIYQESLRPHLLPRIGKHQLNKLTVAHVKSAFAEIAEVVSPSSANRCRRVLRAMLQDAWREDRIIQNVVAKTRPYPEQIQEVQVWSIAQTLEFLEVAKSHRLYCAFHLAAHTGMRHGEILGLRWQDLEADHLNVRQTLTNATKGAKRISLPKTERGKRDIYLDTETLTQLELWRQRQNLERFSLGATWGTLEPEYGDLVFTTAIGTPIIPRNFDRVWEGLRDKSKLPKIKFHAMRHFSITYLVSKGFSIPDIAQRLGQDPAVTMKIYLHSFEGNKRAMAIPVEADSPTPAKASEKNSK